MYNILSFVETDRGVILQSDIREGISREQIKVRIAPKLNRISIIRYDEVLAFGTFKKKQVQTIRHAQNVILTYEDALTGNVASLYIKGG